ncbi:MAG: hypothetical protein K0S61_4784 [Anaerocolumna sp.]|jgi:hypothetical protein|nr:hypothetical protein [Anaerocolumna sp.]
MKDKTMDIKELNTVERLKLSLQYSISPKHKKDLRRRIAELESGQISLFGGNENEYR